MQSEYSEPKRKTGPLAPFLFPYFQLYISRVLFLANGWHLNILALT